MTVGVRQYTLYYSRLEWQKELSGTFCYLDWIFRRVERIDYWAYSKHLSIYFQPEWNILWLKIPQSIWGTCQVRATNGQERIFFFITHNSLLYLDLLISGNLKLNKHSNQMQVNVITWHKGSSK